jgi:L-arabinose isomerase
MKTCRIGLFGVGLDAYWPQFKGLKSRLEHHLEQVRRKLARPGVEIVNLGLVDSPAKALEAGHRFRREDVDLIFIHVTTYALSATVLPVVQRAKVPVVVLNLAPEPAMDYAKFNRLKDRTAMTGKWLENCSACAVPEIANVFQRANIPFHQVSGILHHDPVCWDEVDAWIEAGRVANIMFHNRLGLMGHYYGGMLDVASDLTRHCVTFGGHIEIIEVDELARMCREVTAGQMARRVHEFYEKFEVETDCRRVELERAARTSVALDRLVAEHDLG